MEKLEWLPLYIDKLLSSPAWQDMKDYQRGWYIQLLLRCSRSEPLGYVRLDARLWTIAGASRSDFWESHKSRVMACFEVRQIGGQDYLYNKKLLDVMEKQNEKVKKRPKKSTSLSLDVSGSNLGKTVSKFMKPTLEEVISYCDDRKSSVDPYGFFEYQESVGWMVGKKKMVSWQATIRYWERGNETRQAATESGICTKHPDSGKTPWGSCWDCYQARHSMGASA